MKRAVRLWARLGPDGAVSVPTTVSIVTSAVVARPAERARSVVWACLAATLLLAAGLGAAVGQAPLPDDAADALGRAQRAASEASISYPRHTPDLPLWVDALQAGREAVRAAPDHPAPRRFLAQAYLQMGWYARSWTAFQEYLERGGTVDASVQRQLVETASWLGRNAFDQGRRDRAAPYLRTVLDYEPFDLGANVRLARYHLDRGEPLLARPYLEAVDGRFPDLAPELERVRTIDLHGAAAAEAYFLALEAVQDGALARAATLFTEAAEHSPDFVDARLGAGDAAERLGRVAQAESHYRAALARAPGDAAALAGLGRAAFARADYAAAADRFRAAAAAAPDTPAYAEAVARSERLLAAQEQAAAAAEAARARAAAEAARATATAEAAEAEEEAEAARAEASRVEAAQAAARAETARAESTAARDAERAAEAAEAARAAEDARAAEAAAAAEAAERSATVQPSADDLVLIDVTHEHRRSASIASSAIAFYARADLALDLTDRTSHRIDLRLDVYDKPSDLTVRYQLCLVPTDIAVTPACTDPGLLPFSGVGVVAAQVAWSDLNGFARIDWTRGIDAIMLIARRDDGEPIDASPVGGATPDAYLPMRLRVRATATPVAR